MGEYINKGMGKAKRTFGRATGNERMEGEGAIQEGKGRLQETGRHVKNAIEDVGRSVRPKRKGTAGNP